MKTVQKAASKEKTKPKEQKVKPENPIIKASRNLYYLLFKGGL